MTNMKKCFILLLSLCCMTLFAEDDINTHLIDLALPSGTLSLGHNLGATNNCDHYCPLKSINNSLKHA